ncbi:MAG: response regulator [Burkholderiales bacterium]|nr:response regulator [Burkholderiales bacterium]
MTNSNVKAPLILFVDDEEHTVKYFQRAVGAFAQVITASNVKDGMQLLDEHAGTLAVLISDQRMPNGYGNQLLHYARDRYPNMVRILTTAYSELEQTIEAVNQGQIDRYMQKPWDITVLRLELKLALELASLRKGHTSLLQEKLEVLQKQITSNRIGNLQSMCIALVGDNYLWAIDTYLRGALLVDVKSPSLNWSKNDYFELVSAEALRNGNFARLLKRHMEIITAQEWKISQFEERAGELLGDLMAVEGNGKLRLTQERFLADYLENPAQLAVGEQHIAWLALLLWVEQCGYQMQIERQAPGLYCHIQRFESEPPEMRLANWIEQF